MSPCTSPHPRSGLRPTRCTPLALCLALLCALSAAVAQTQQNDFEGTSIAPYLTEICCGNTSELLAPATHRPNAGRQALKITWFEANYDGSRASRGAEIRGGRSSGQHQWYGLSLFIPKNYPPDKNQILAQLIGWHPACETNKTVTLSLLDDGVVRVEGFADNETVNQNGTIEGVRVFEQDIAVVIPRDRWITIVFYARYSAQGNGTFRFWWDHAPENAPTFEITGIDLGDGCFDAGTDIAQYGFYPKFGLYAYDVGGYTPGESRVLWYDDIAWIDGDPAGAFETVRPPRINQSSAVEGTTW